MDRYTEILRQQRGLEAPFGTVDQVEQQVMSRLARLPAERRRRRTLVAATLIGVLFLVVLFVHRPHPRPASPPEFIESVVILDDHVAIWLEVPNAGTGRSTGHE